MFSLAVVSIAQPVQLYDSMADRIQKKGNDAVRMKLEQMNESLRNELKRTGKTLQDKEAWYAGKLKSEEDAHSEREGKLRADLGAMYRKWNGERSWRTTAEESVTMLSKELDQYRNDLAKYKKKVRVCFFPASQNGPYLTTRCTLG